MLRFTKSEWARWHFKREAYKCADARRILKANTRGTENEEIDEEK